MHPSGAILALLLACGGASNPAVTPAQSALAAAPAPHPDLPRCTCMELEAKLRIPTDVIELARWNRAKTALEATHDELAALFTNRACPPTINGDVARVIAANAAALDDDRALNRETCDHFAQWRMENTDATAELAILEAVRGGCMLLSAGSRMALSRSSITRGCTGYVNE